MKVVAPASSANLGPGFDCLALALDMPFELSADAPPPSEESPTTGSYHEVDHGHPAWIAYLAAGGDPAARLWWRSPIPPGRGMGYSGAARVAGAYLGAFAGLYGTDDGAAQAAFGVASELEGHADNAAASTYGGFCVVGPGGPLRVDPPGELLSELRLVTWSPRSGTSTSSARTRLARSVPFDSATASIAGASAWVAAIATGRLDGLRAACEDRLHQPERLAKRADSASFLDHVLADSRTLAAWLSGSGPSIAALVHEADSRSIVAELERHHSDGAIRIVPIAAGGVRAILD